MPGPMDAHIAEMCRKDEEIELLNRRIEALQTQLNQAFVRAAFDAGFKAGWLQRTWEHIDGLELPLHPIIEAKWAEYMMGDGE